MRWRGAAQVGDKYLQGHFNYGSAVYQAAVRSICAWGNIQHVAAILRTCEVDRRNTGTRFRSVFKRRVRWKEIAQDVPMKTVGMRGGELSCTLGYCTNIWTDRVISMVLSFWRTSVTAGGGFGRWVELALPRACPNTRKMSKGRRKTEMQSRSYTAFRAWQETSQNPSTR